jgi:hypothetical protein
VGLIVKNVRESQPHNEIVVGDLSAIFLSMIVLHLKVSLAANHCLHINRCLGRVWDRKPQAIVSLRNDLDVTLLHLLHKGHALTTW